MNARHLLCVLVVAAVAVTEGLAAQAPRVTLTEMVSEGWIGPADRELADMFARETGIAIDWQVNPANRHHELLKGRLAGDDVPDIFWIQSNRFIIRSELDPERTCIDFSAEPWVRSMTPVKAESVSWKGKVYGQAFFMKGVSYPVIYNRTLFRELGIPIPRTWAAFRAACDRIRARGIVPVFESVPAGWHHVLWIMQIGGRFSELQPGIVEQVNENRLRMTDVRGFVTAVEQLQEMARNGYFGPDFLTNELGDWAKQLSTRKAAMYLGQAGGINTLLDRGSRDEFGLFLIPLVDNQTSQTDPAGPARFGSARSPHRREIRSYFEFLARKENLQYKLDHTPVWTAIDVADSVGITQHYLPAERNLLASIPAERQGVIWQNAVSYVNDQWMDIGRDLAAMFAGTMTPLQVVQAIDERRGRIARAAGDPGWK